MKVYESSQSNCLGKEAHRFIFGEMGRKDLEVDQGGLKIYSGLEI